MLQAGERPTARVFLVHAQLVTGSRLPGASIKFGSPEASERVVPSGHAHREL